MSLEFVKTACNLTRISILIIYKKKKEKRGLVTPILFLVMLEKSYKDKYKYYCARQWLFKSSINMPDLPWPMYAASILPLALIIHWNSCEVLPVRIYWQVKKCARSLLADDETRISPRADSACNVSSLFFPIIW